MSGKRKKAPRLTYRDDSNVLVLRRGIVRSLRKQGFIYKRGKITLPNEIDKEGIRRLHQESVQMRLEKSKKELLRWEPKLLSYIAEGKEIVPDKISPYLVQVESGTENELLFRYASLHWSIPVSSGYGRRMRFLLFDDSNGKLIGLLGLGDPVFNLAARDEWIGWNKEQQKNNLKHIMDAFVVGSIPPYSQLLCGKLVAMLLASNEIRETFKKKYRGQRSFIKRKIDDGRLVLITTASALGRSSIYNRISYNGRHLFKHVGYTSGSGEFHFSNGLYADLAKFASLHCKPTAKQKRWGIGFRNKREIVRKVLPLLGLPCDLMYHQIKREVFTIPLAKNAREFLRGEHERVQWFDIPAKAIFEYFKDRWLLGRAERNPSYLLFQPSSYALWTREGRILYGQ